MAATELPDVGIDMVREGLEDLPAFELPEGYSIRRYRAGDDQTWTDIHLAAEKSIDITGGLFAKEFESDPEALAERQLFLCEDAGHAIGTATAWFGDYRDEGIGRVHWLAILPEQQGRGLSRPLLAATCARLRELGHTRTFLTTSTRRLAAVRLYLRFGFRADPVNDAQRAGWAAACRRLRELGVEVPD